MLLSAYLYFLSHKWRELGFQLGLSQELLDIISQTPPPTSPNIFPVHEYHFRLMLIAWVRQLKGKSKPSLLARALSAVGADTWDKWSILVQSKQALAPKIYCHNYNIIISNQRSSVGRKGFLRPTRGSLE